MKQIVLAAFAIVLVSACATAPTPYGPAASSKAKGFSEQQIEDNRFRVAYSGDSAAQARDYALLRAAQLTLEQGKDWFRVTNAYTEAENTNGRGGGNTSVSIGGSSGSYGSGLGVGIGIGLPLGGGGGSKDATHDLEIITGSGEKPTDANVYDARAVEASFLGAPSP